MTSTFSTASLSHNPPHQSTNVSSTNTNISNNSASSSNASGSSNSAHLLSMAQHIAQQDIKKMFAGIQSTHLDIFEEAKHWDGKLPVRKPPQRTSHAAKQHAREDAQFLDDDFSETQSNLTEDVENDTRGMHYTQIKSTKDTTIVSQQPEKRTRTKAVSRHGVSHQRGARHPAEKPAPSTKSNRRGAQQSSASVKKPPSGVRSKPPTGRLHQKRLERRTTKSVSIMSHQPKTTFDESTMIEKPHYHDENIQTSPVGAEMQVQQGESMLDYEPAQKEQPHRSIDPNKEELRRRQALQSISPKKVSKRMLHGVADATGTQTRPPRRRSPGTTAAQETSNGRSSPSRLMRERAKRKRILKSAPPTRLARAPSPSKLHEQHSRITEIGKQQQEASRWKSHFTPLNLPPTEEHDDEGRRSSFSARMLPRDALETTTPTGTGVARPQKRIPSKQEQKRQVESHRETIPVKTLEEPTTKKPKSKVTIIPPPQNEGSFDQTAVTNDLSNLTEAPTPSQMEEINESSVAEERPPKISKNKLFEQLKISLLKNRSQIDDTVMSEQQGEHEQTISAPFVLHQTDNSSVQIETIIEKPRGQEQQRKRAAQRTVSPEPRFDKSPTSPPRKRSSPREASPKKRSSSPQHARYEEEARNIEEKPRAITKRKVSPSREEKKKKPKVTFDDLATPQPANQKLRLSLLDLQRSLDGVQIEQLFDIMDEHNKEHAEIRKRLVESKRSPSASLSCSPTGSLKSSQDGNKPNSKRRKLMSKLRESTDMRRSSFNVSEFLSPIRSREDPKVGFLLSELERAQILAVKAENDAFWRKTANSIGEVCSDVEPHVLFEIIADVIHEEVFDQCAVEVKRISDEAVQNLFKAEFDASSLEFNDSNLGASVDSSGM